MALKVVDKSRVAAACTAAWAATEFFILHLQFDLMDLQLVDQGANVCFRHDLRGLGLPREKTLLSLAT